jgi:hypothetical protein
MLPPHLTHRQKPRAKRADVPKRVAFFRLLAPVVPGRVDAAAQRLPIKPPLPQLKSRLRVLDR